jgi:basic amino acid/polyamine antiporter, APA family
VLVAALPITSIVAGLIVLAIGVLYRLVAGAVRSRRQAGERHPPA